MDIRSVNILVLAYIGDTVYENYVRHYLVNKGINNVDTLQTQSINFVSANNQAKYVNKLIDEDFFTEDELSVFRRARNYKSSRHPKNTDIVTYKNATGLEAIIGFLDLTNNKDRIDLLMSYILKGD
jgi:ribonuclease-3 family protein